MPTVQATSQPQQAPSVGASEGQSYDSDPFGPNGITYENLSKEVQDMAMHSKVIAGLSQFSGVTWELAPKLHVAT